MSSRKLVKESIWYYPLKIPVVHKLVYYIAKKWIAGETKLEAIYASEEANTKGFSTIVNYLGEELEDKDEVVKTIKEYKEMLNLIDKKKIDGCISVKLTQLGLSTGNYYCKNNLQEIVNHVKNVNNFVWIDMEGSKFTDDTLDIYSSVFSKNKNVGICIQSYLKRSMKDVNRLIDIGGKIRLVKGAYKEPRHLAYDSRNEVDENFSKIMEHLFKNSSSLFSIATHDDKLVYKATDLSKEHHRKFEFGMLKGVRDNLKSELVEKGFKVTEYIPYGEKWLQYSVRRIREKPSNILLLFRSMISK